MRKTAIRIVARVHEVIFPAVAEKGERLISCCRVAQAINAPQTVRWLRRGLGVLSLMIKFVYYRCQVFRLTLKGLPVSSYYRAYRLTVGRQATLARLSQPIVTSLGHPDVLEALSDADHGESPNRSLADGR